MTIQNVRVLCDVKLAVTTPSIVYVMNYLKLAVAKYENDIVSFHRQGLVHCGLILYNLPWYLNRLLKSNEVMNENLRLFRFCVSCALGLHKIFLMMMKS